MKNNSQAISPEEISKITLSNIIDMALGFSAMMRLFKKDSKTRLYKRTVSTVKQVFNAESQEEFKRIHSEFCEWGGKEIFLAKKKQTASYGQIAKTLDVVLKVAVNYCHLPEYEKSKLLSQWLNAAVDNKMMRMLKQRYGEAFEPWPRAIQEVKRPSYLKIQDTVRKFIKEKHNDSIVPVQFDDYYWRKLNRPSELFTIKD